MTTREVAEARQKLADLEAQAGAWHSSITSAKVRLRNAEAKSRAMREEIARIDRALAGFQQNLMGGTARGGQTILGERKGAAADMRARRAELLQILEEFP